MLQFFSLSADIISFPIAVNDGSGNGVWTANISAQVYSANHTNGSAPVFTSVPVTMSAVGAGNGRYAQKINITGGTFRPNVWFNVYVHASVSGTDIQPTGALGAFIVTEGIRSNAVQIDGASVSAGISAVVDTAMDNIGVAISANLETRLATISGAVAAVSAIVLTSGETSVICANALDDLLLHTLIVASASTTAIHNNSIIGQIMATADPNDFVRGTDSLAAIADGAGATPLTSAATSVVVANALDDLLLHTLMVASASVTALNANSIIGRLMASADPVAFDRDTDSLAAISNRQLTSAGVSSIANTALVNRQVPTSAAVSAIVSVVAAQALSDYDAPTAAELATTSANLNTNIGVVSAAVAAVSALIITSAETSGIVAQGISDYDGPTAAEMATMSANLNTNIGAVSAAVVAVSAIILTSAETSAIVRSAILSAQPIPANVVQIRGVSADAVTQQAILSAVVVGSARTGSLTTTITHTNLTSANFPNTDIFKGRLMTFIGTAGKDREQLEILNASTSGAFVTLTHTTATQAATNTQKFIIS